MRRRHFGRAAVPRVTGRKVIIVCEGKKTEVNYFNSIRTHFRLPTLKVEVTHPGCTDPHNLVKEAAALVSERKSARAWSSGDTAWAVFDGDEHKQSNPTNWNNALQLAVSRNIQLAVSNPSFELWYLLHFQDQTGSLHRDQALSRLRSHYHDYKKTISPWPVPLKDLTANAMSRANTLHRRIQEEELEPHANPCSGVGNLVALLLELSEERGT